MGIALSNKFDHVVFHGVDMNIKWLPTSAWVHFKVGKKILHYNWPKMLMQNRPTKKKILLAGVKDGNNERQTIGSVSVTVLRVQLDSVLNVLWEVPKLSCQLIDSGFEPGVVIVPFATLCLHKACCPGEL